MKLSLDPNAELGHVDGFERIIFTCHEDGCCIMCRFVRDREAFRLDEDTFVWKATGEFPETFTLTPSVDAKEYKGGPSHWHGHVMKGVAL